MGKLLLILPLLLLAVACETTGPKDAGRRAAPAPGGGRAIYERSCQRCHALYMPSSFEADEWGFFVRKYGRKARLDRDEQSRVLDYLVRNSRGGGKELAPGQFTD